MRIALVAMPWGPYTEPNAAPGVLSAYIKQEEPEIQVDCHYPCMDLYERFGMKKYHDLANDLDGEYLYASLVHPEHRQRGFAIFAERLAPKLDAPGMARSYFDETMAAMEEHLNEVIQKLKARYDVVGFTTTYGELYSSLAAAMKLKQLEPSVTIVLGGLGVYGAAGSAILRDHECVDFVIQGEGETPLLELLRALRDDDIAHISERAPSALTAESAALSHDLPLSQQADLDLLPPPDHDDYADRANSSNILWCIPVEGSRGCWRDVSRKTGDPLKACRFCSETGFDYRSKSPQRFAEEIDVLAERYGVTRFRFQDSAFPTNRRGLELARALQEIPRDLEFFACIRANISPLLMLELWKAGCVQFVIGIEGLSTSYLRKMGKATNTIHNLQALKIAFELGISVNAYLITNFPTADTAEVDETISTISRYAIAYEPCTISAFTLHWRAPICQRPEAFGLSRIRPREQQRDAFPGELWNKRNNAALTYESTTDAADWSGVEDAVEKWQALHDRLRFESRWIQDGLYRMPMPLSRYDGGTFMEIVDRRAGYKTITLDGLWRDVYHACSQIRRIEELQRIFADQCSSSDLETVVADLASEDLIYREGNALLALATARRPDIAERRIRSMV